MEFTRQAARVQNAWQNLKKNAKSYNDTMDTAVQGSKEYNDALSSMQKEAKVFFGDSKKVTKEWTEAHRKDIQSMVEGDEEALERLQDDLIGLELGDHGKIHIEADGVDNVYDAIDMLEDKFKDLEDGAIIRPEMDTSGALDSLLDLWASGSEAAQGIQDALNAVGYQPEIEYEDVPLTSLMQEDGTVKIPVIDYDPESGLPSGYHYEYAPANSVNAENGMVHIPKINPKTGKLSAVMKKTSAG